MPAIRSFYTLTVLAACLAQAYAGDSSGGNGGSWGGSGGSGEGCSGSNCGGDSKGSFGGGMNGGGSWNGGNQYTSAAYTPPAMAQSCPPAPSCPSCPPQMAQSCPEQKCPPPATMTITETSTITAASPCSSVVTAYVTQWMNAPPGCFCGSGSPPPFVSMMEVGGNTPLGNAPVITTAVGALSPGLSSIPAAEAVQTGVTVAAAAAAPKPTAAAVSPGGFFDTSMSMPVATISGTETSGSSSVPSSNISEATKTGEAKPEATTSTTSSSTSSASSAATTSISKTGATFNTDKAAASSPASSSSTTTTAASSTTPVSTAAVSSSVADAGGVGAGSFSTLDPASLTLKNAYTLGIGRRDPAPTLS
ncbi:hypothetical protein PV05_04866 [Exophiala xenobiotica]|uniref:Uncharacterized protein n=1 Tax=Exophiala xenobiotica TaxID=348802 RepID=A0A0D2D190_9EURO|nr:uncharacterized protein PV05_04866 [Exophiala xenobiotica]KIW56187.1 hypothetical protein PV05_04866 [Exophiala xenobiotica]